MTLKLKLDGASVTLDMKKEYVVRSIDAAPDGAPYVVVSLSSVKDLKEGTQNPQPPFGSPKVMGFSNMNDMMKDLNKMLSGMGGMGMQSGITQLKLEMHEYKEMGLSVGDKVFLELSKAESLGV
ncbi:hypothetical protein AAA799E16_01733 [Marine Group I thaumarchaeote SCGC AAA799-E16]|nr:hypothetical protein AAA799N04_00473 [Marine Group I thaumarchaeote SCGC AAA799-N04]KER05615.1 hypothetical protein AAA799E16_01733 [Marine Group I thaumarchaeote SCGC AAA799-E16]KFM17045.1 hypothetical protein AAA799D11_00359 [Marine Group I thaumarchaeote SCGC AAA799-D11]KFM19147.1 hypothetical protein SCCGRSA3_00727 [Marine Group I thaumarchaeote SCGC RSA3]